MIRTLLQPVLWTSRVLKKAIFRVQMNKFTLLKTPFWNIFYRELKTREELSQIRQTFADFSIPFLRKGTPPKVLLFPTSDLLCAPECAPALRY